VEINLDKTNTVHKFVLTGYNCSVIISAPYYFFKLISLMLFGWKLSYIEQKGMFELNISKKNNLYVINSSLQYIPKPRSDIIDTLNEIFLCLSYLLAAKNHNARLLHCASFLENNSYKIVVASKKSGKSSLLFNKSQTGICVAGDDLILWFPKEGNFMCIGLPVRMRRPVIYKIDNNKMIAGKNIAYSLPNHIKCLDVGHFFEIDKVFTLVDYRLINVPLIFWTSTLSRYLIDKSFIRLQ